MYSAVFIHSIRHCTPPIATSVDTIQIHLCFFECHGMRWNELRHPLHFIALLIMITASTAMTDIASAAYSTKINATQERGHRQRPINDKMHAASTSPWGMLLCLTNTLRNTTYVMTLIMKQAISAMLFVIIFRYLFFCAHDVKRVRCPVSLRRPVVYWVADS